MYFRINENNLKLPTLRILPNLYIFFYFKTILFYEKKTHIQPSSGTYKDWLVSPPFISKKKFEIQKNHKKDQMTS